MRRWCGDGVEVVPDGRWCGDGAEMVRRRCGGGAALVQGRCGGGAAAVRRWGAPEDWEGAGRGYRVVHGAEGAAEGAEGCTCRASTCSA